MDITKRSMKWLVAVIVVFALVLTAVFAAGNVATAHADIPQMDVVKTVSAAITGTDTTGDVSHLMNTNSWTITVKYYYDVTDATVDGSVANFDLVPFVKDTENEVIRPSSITVNSAFSEYATLATGYANYLATYSGALPGSSMVLDLEVPEDDISFFDGVDAQGAAIDGKELFTVTYEIAANSATGVYTVKDNSVFSGMYEGDTVIYAMNDAAATFTLCSPVQIPEVTTPQTYTGETLHGIATSNDYSVSGNDGVTVGNYEAVAHLTGAYTCWSDGTVADKTFPWAIEPAAVPVPVLVTDDFDGQDGEGIWYFVYDGETHEIFWTSASVLDQPIEYGIDGQPAGTKSGVDAGTYDVEVDLTDTDNYVWVGGGTETKVYTFKILPKQIVKPTIAEESRTYNTEAQTYSGSGEGYTFTGTGTAIGNYDVTVSLASANYVWSDGTNAAFTAEGVFHITPKQIEVPTSANVWTYDGQSHAFVLGNTVDSAWYTYTQPAQITNVSDSTTVTVSLNDPNTTWTDGTTAAKIFDFTITAKAASLSFTDAPYVRTYGQSILEIEVTATGLIGNDDLGTLGYSVTKGGVPAVLGNVGEYVLTATYTATENSNYDVTGAQTTYTINVRSIAKPVAVQHTFDYNGEPRYIIFGDVDTNYVTLVNEVSRTYVGTTTAAATASLKDTTNTVWENNGGTDPVTYDLTVNAKKVTAPTADSTVFVYTGSSQTYTLATSADYTITGVTTKTNAGTNTITVSLNDKNNTVWSTGGTADAEYTFTINKFSVVKPELYNQTYTYNGNTQYCLIIVDETAAAYFQTTNNSRVNVGSQTVYNTLYDTDNTQWSDGTTAPIEFTFTINVKKVAIPTTTGATAFDYDGEAHSLTFTDTDDSAWYDITGNSLVGPGATTVYATLKEAHAGNIQWTDETTAAKEFTLTVNVVSVKIWFRSNEDFLNYNKDTGAWTEDDGMDWKETEFNVLESLPSAPSYRYFANNGWKFGNEIVDTVTLAMAQASKNGVDVTLTVNYVFNVGKGDLNGDGLVTTYDLTQLKLAKMNVIDPDDVVASETDAWELRNTTGDYNKVFATSYDVTLDTDFVINDITAVRAALATGYNYRIVAGIDVTGQSVKFVEFVEVSTLTELRNAVKQGLPARLIANIAYDPEDTIELQNLDEEVTIPVEIDLNGFSLTVNYFSLTSQATDVTLSIYNGTLYVFDDIVIAAPNGNVKLDNVTGYNFVTDDVILSAASSSLHFERVVQFLKYPGGDLFQDKIAATATVAALSSANTEEKEAAEAAIAVAPAAPVSVPVDTHVVVEEAATLTVEKINVVEARAENNQDASTFTINVKNTAQEEIIVDITAVKDELQEVYVVTDVEITAEADNVTVYAGENTEANVAKMVAKIGTQSYETLQAAIDAAQNGDVIKLMKDVTDGTGIKTADDNAQKTKVGKTFTIDFNGFTYTVDGAGVGSTGTETQAMHWGEKDNITLKNGSLVISVDGATVPNPANNKVIKMAMQNYANLTIKDMTLDFSNIVVLNYGNYTGEYAPYSGLEIPLFNLNAGSMIIDNTTITMPNASTKGVLIEIPDAATIKNSTINGYVSLGQLDSNVTIENSTVSGVVSYFAGYGVKNSGNVYRLGGVSVTNYTELQAALDAGALIIDVENDFNAPSPIAVSKSTIINGYDHTITSSGNRILNVTMPDVVLTINDLTLTKASNVAERGINIWNNATGTDITLNNVTIDAWLYAINYVNGADNETLTINNSNITGWAAINAHCNNSSFTVNDTTLYGINRNCDSVYAYSTVVIDGDSLNGAQEGDHGVDNTFVFNGCTIIAEVTLTHQYWISFQYAATGNTATVVVNNCRILDAPNGTDKSSDMNITGTNNAVVLPLSANQYAVVVAKHFNITDNGDGTYTIMPKTANISYFGTPYNFYDVFENGWLEDTEAFTLTDDVVLDTDVVFARNRAAAIAVSGGTFEMNLDGNTISGDGKILLPVGVTCVTDSTVSIASVFEAPEGEVIIESVDADGNYIYAVGVAYVKTKAEFTAAITAGAKKLVICADINLSMYTYNRDMDITIDLNGYTLTTTMTGITFSAARTLNILDTSINGTGAINSTGNYAINMGTASTAATVINIYGGTLTGKTSAAVKVNDGTLNVYGGTLTCPAADKYAILNYQGYAGTVNIYDGTFTAAVAVANNGTGVVNIYGGTFSADPSAYLAEGYATIQQGNMWTVGEAMIAEGSGEGAQGNPGLDD